MSEQRIAEELWRAARDHEQGVRRIPDDDAADAVRAAVRQLAKEAGVRIRTARMGDIVAVVRLDAAIWHQDAATMRRTLTPDDPTADQTGDQTADQGFAEHTPAD